MAIQERPAKRTKLLDYSDSDAGSDDDSGEVVLNHKEPKFKVNEDYARRFEHNQKRAELHQLEEKYGPTKHKQNGAGQDDDEDSSSTDEEEDDDGILASGMLDEEVNATLKALKSKDPRVYDKSAMFYTATDNDDASDAESKPKEKPVHLRDYHRENLLRGHPVDEDGDAPPTYVQQQDSLRRQVVKEMHAAAESDSASSADNSDNDADEGFLIKKQKQVSEDKGKARDAISMDEIQSAEKDPEIFLDKFLNSRGWVTSTGTELHPFESDDDDEENKAEQFEAAYNLRFENPEAANEKLVSHARDAATKYSVRQESVNKRKRAREAEQAKKDEMKKTTTEEKARLRRLRLDEAEQKINKIKEAAGLGKQPVKLEEWQDFLTEDWDDRRWEAEMKKKFGDDYYAGDDHPDRDEEATSKRKIKKPKWDDDIDITDLVSDFDAGNDANFSLSENDDEEANGTSSSAKKSKQKAKGREEQKREARKERRRIEQLVDEKLDVDFALDGTSKKGPSSAFRYRDTSPSAFGLTPKDILLASDSQLNQYHGLKKLAAFRDADKKRKDKKHLGKKARLRQWRRETFGNDQGPQKSLQDLVRESQGDVDPAQTGANAQEVKVDVGEGKRRKRSKKH